MKFHLRTRKQMWLFVATITTGSVLISQASIFAIWLVLGADAFQVANVVLIGSMVPIVVALPVSFLIGRMGWELSQTHSQLRHLADTDPLTGLINRRHFFAQAQSHLARCQAEGKPVSLIVVDADHFKDLNDTYGHAVGDEALVAISKTLRGNFRRTDLICRVGGEEFAVLLPGVAEVNALPLAKRLVERVGTRPLSTTSAIIEYSISCGVADSQISYEIQSLYKAADDAMYVAKREGRNRVAQLAA